MGLPRILLISTGGTIAMVPSASGGVTPALTGEDLVKTVPALSQYCTLEPFSYTNKPGASLSWLDMLEISKLLNERLSQEDFVGAIVVQGTDTIEETAFVYDLLVSSDKPVVVTGAMRSATMTSADGPGNLLDAAIVASSKTMSAQGTLVVLNGEIHAARHVQKSHTAQVQAFTSPGLGPLGIVAEGLVLPYFRLQRTQRLAIPAQNRIPEILVLKAALADKPTLLLKAIEIGFGGIVIEAMGAGHLPAHYAQAISDVSTQIPVVLSTRVPSGPVFTHTYGFTGSEMDSLERGAIYSGILGSLRARILLSLLLAQCNDLPTIKTAFTSRALPYSFS